MKPAICLLVCLCLSACSADQSAPTSLQLDKLRGQWVVINYWAKWCKPCVTEIPELNRLNQAYEQVTVLGVNFDGTTGTELDQELLELGVAFPTLADDPAQQLGIARPQVLPTTLIIGPEGALRATLLGPQTLESLALATEQAHSPANDGHP